MGSQTTDPGVDVPSAPPCGPPVDFVPAARGVVPSNVQYLALFPAEARTKSVWASARDVAFLCTTAYVDFSFAFDTLSCISFFTI